MSKDDMMHKVGSWSFLIGILIALIAGLYHAYTAASVNPIFFTTDAGGLVAWVLAIIGVIVGVLSVLGRGTITKKETPSFLLAGIALVVMGGIFYGLFGGILGFLAVGLVGFLIAHLFNVIFSFIGGIKFHLE